MTTSSIGQRPVMEEKIKKLLLEMVERNASDLHLKADYPPIFRIDGNLVISEYSSFSSDEIRKLCYSFLTSDQIERFEQEWELDCAIEIEKIARYRINLYLQRGKIGAAIRMLPLKIPTISECGLPEDVIVEKLLRKKKGLILVTGPTGSGKSTSIAAMLEWINQNKKGHIITVEDPIEYVHTSKQSIINQREVGTDTHSFNHALRHVLREDPDVILIGEMRDLETIESALNIAETGHLVFSTLHTPDAVQSINRIVDVFPSYKQDQVRIQLSFVLLAVLTQQLLPRKEGSGRVLAYELMLANHAVRSMIREKKGHQIYSVIQTSQSEGMSTMNQCLAKLYLNGDISYEQAIHGSMDPEDLKKLIERAI
ncbi:MAG TPA: type IV pilus twitching motility protein PilT [Candidatus Omnitrophica bacterium]|nr:type IV pilus twitching motility protein PilT [Candidatus Omnitrophota bacterium]